MCINGLNKLKTLTSKTSSTFFVTTPIYYVNASPHIGHLYSSVIADAIARWRCLVDPSPPKAPNLKNSPFNNSRVKLSTGTDEHGTKIQQAAQKHNTNPSDYCDRISSRYKHLAHRFGVNYTDFVRTTDDAHVETVRNFWNLLKSRDRIYKAKYEGWYCVSDETFLAPSQLKENIGADGTSKTIVSEESGHPVEWTEEVNYMFPLQAFREDVKYWISRNEDRIRPAKFKKILLELLDSGELRDISISRPSSRVHWGIPVPDDDSQTVYVWLDALANYLTAATSGPTGSDPSWPPAVQVIGKDILKFHGIYWPAFLMAAGLEPPASILCHSHWTVEGEKMSKSKGNVVCPLERSDVYTAEGLRYFLLREGVAHSDGNYSDIKILRILNSELADTLGNLLSRCCGSALNPLRTVPGIDDSTLRHVLSLPGRGDVARKLLETVANLPAVCRRHYSDCNFYRAVDEIMATLHQTNAFFEKMRPWDLKKRVGQQEDLDVVLHVTLETLRVCAILLQPIIPILTARLLDRIAVPVSKRCFADAVKLSWNGCGPSICSRRLDGENEVLFRRIVRPEDKKRRAA